MGNRILGLDISSGGVKAVQVKADLNGRFRITGFASYDVRTPEDLAEAVRKIREDVRLQSDLWVTSLPASAFSFRNLRMPFREKRKIRQTLAFELEPLIPHPVEDVVADFVVLEQSDHPGKKPADAATVSDLFVAAVLKEAVREKLRVLEPAQVPLVEVEAVPTALALVEAGYCRQEPFVLLDVGAAETVAVFVRGGSVFHVRSFGFGGAAMTGAVARSLNVDPDEAERKKRTGLPEAAGAEIARLCEGFFAELSHTMQYLNLRGPDERPSKLILTGGGALCNPFMQALARHFPDGAERLDLRAMRHISLPAETAEAWDPMRMNNALALAIRGTRKGNGFNFRKGEFASGGYALMFRENIRRIAAVLLIVFGILVFDSAAGYLIDQRRLSGLKSEVAGVLRKNCPDITRVVDPVQQLKTRVVEAKRFASTGAGGEVGVLDLLKKISEAAPPSANWLITDLNYDGEKMEIRGETDNFDSVETIKRGVAGSGLFKNVTVGGANLVKGKNKIEFDLRMSCAR